jgi:hypothetical protein
MYFCSRKLIQHPPIATTKKHPPLPSLALRLKKEFEKLKFYTNAQKKKKKKKKGILGLCKSLPL